MITIEKLDITNKKQVNRYIDMPYHLYADCPQWVPPIRMDMAEKLNPKKHPFYEHSDVECFIAVRDGVDVGRIAAIENRSSNDYHGKKIANFYFFESENDIEISRALFNTVYDWSSARGLDTLVGPKGMGPLDGYGIQVEGFEHRQMMTMMNYNHPYIPEHMKALGFEKEVDFISCYAGSGNLDVPERVHRIADRVQKRGRLKVKSFKNKKELREWADRIGKAYNETFVNNWEYFPLTKNEIDYILDNILLIADPKLIKIIIFEDELVVGFLFGFADISAAIQRSKGRLFPFGLIDILIEMRRSKWIAINGLGILPEYQGRGGHALLYAEMENTIRDFGFEHADLTQVAESAVEMRSDLVTVGGIPYKNHRVYRKNLNG